jgi:hypothetical protein
MAKVIDGRQRVALLRVVQRIVETRDGTAGVAESAMLGDIRDPFAINVDFAAILKAREILRTIQQQIG